MNNRAVHFERELIESWRPTEVEGIELRRGFGVARPVPRHWHEEYQFCLIQAGSGELHYRRDTIATPPASLFIVHPGEVHSNRAHDSMGCSYRTLFVSTAMMKSAHQTARCSQNSLPFFSDAITCDRRTTDAYLRLHFAFENSTSALERQSVLLQFLTLVLTRHSENSVAVNVKNPAREIVNRVRDYLAEHLAENVSLEELATLAGLSAFHLNRAFAQQFGMPPHAFQMQLRVHRAKDLLRAGCSIAQTALETGFVDQSHLNRQFKRLTGISPGQFKNRKIVQDDRSQLQ